MPVTNDPDKPDVTKLIMKYLFIALGIYFMFLLMIAQVTSYLCRGSFEVRWNLSSKCL